MSIEKDVEAIIRDTMIFHALSDTEGMIGFILALREIDPGTVFLDEDEKLFELLDPDTSIGAFALSAERELRAEK